MGLVVGLVMGLVVGGATSTRGLQLPHTMKLSGGGGGGGGGGGLAKGPRRRHASNGGFYTGPARTASTEFPRLFNVYSDTAADTPDVTVPVANDESDNSAGVGCGCLCVGACVSPTKP